MLKHLGAYVITETATQDGRVGGPVQMAVITPADIFWLNDKSFIDYSEFSDPLDLAREMAQQLETALESIDELVLKLGKS